MALSFPVSPTLNQTYTVGTKTWKWNGSAWDIVAATGVSVDSTARASAAAADGLATAAYGYANTLPTVTYVNNAVANVVNSAPSTLDTLKELADALGSDVNFSTTVATNIGNVNNKSNAAYQHANNAFDAANAATTLIAGVNSYQNTTITAVSNYAAAGYSQTNATNILAQASYDSANTNSTNITLIQGVDVYQNTRITAVDSYATSGYGLANAANNLASAAFLAANNGTGASFAYTQANAATNSAQAAYNYANTLSTLITLVQSVDVYQNTRTNSVESLSTAAFSQANTALSTAQNAWNAANNASGGGGTGAGINYTASASVPVSSNTGDQWYNTTENILYEYIYDGTSYFWIDTTSAQVTTDPFLTDYVLHPLLLSGL